MRLKAIEIYGYRSVRSLKFNVDHLNVLVGANGTGKTNIYQALSYLRAAATGGIALQIVKEGGVSSVFWAGPRRRNEKIRLKLQAIWDEADYSIELGLPAPAEAALDLEPLIKSEEVAIRTRGKRIAVLQRKGPSIQLRNDDGRKEMRSGQLLASETALANLIDAERYPILGLVRRTLLSWRFYHGFRADAGSPLRQPCPAVATTKLAGDGKNLAAVFETLRRIKGDSTDLDQAIAFGFPGSKLLTDTKDGECRFSMQFEDMDRPFHAHELSDGTIRFLALAGALTSYHLPAFLALNEPETSLHPELMPSLAKLAVNASQKTTIWVVTHSQKLADMITTNAGTSALQIVKMDGATQIVAPTDHYTDRVNPPSILRFWPVM